VYLAIQGGWVLSYIEHFWSLAVEEHFYMVWPLLVWLLAARPASRSWARPSPWRRLLRRPRGRLACGVSPVATRCSRPFSWTRSAWAGSSPCTCASRAGKRRSGAPSCPWRSWPRGWLACDFGLHRFTDVGLEAMRAMRGGLFRVAFAALLLQALFAPASSLLARFFRSRPMVALGKYSYGLYVYHHFLSYYLGHARHRVAVAAAVGSHTLAVASPGPAGDRRLDARSLAQLRALREALPGAEALLAFGRKPAAAAAGG
jgi:peptidoglycan/LPS O-acetylase OafA/YrhL